MTDATQIRSTRHHPAEDAQGILFGSAMAAFGILMLTHLGFITGQTAGLAVLISYVTGLPFGLVFFGINIPFFWMGYRRMGLAFTLKTLLAVGLLSLLSVVLPHWVHFGTLNPLVGALLFGALSGTALLALFRHGASLGGVGILAYYLQEKTGFRAGFTQLIFDSCLFLVAFAFLPAERVLYSLVGAVVVNLVLAVNHRRDRYIAA